MASPRNVSSSAACFTLLTVAFLAIMTSSEDTCQNNAPSGCTFLLKNKFVGEPFKLRCPIFNADYNFGFESGSYYTRLNISCTTNNVSDYSELNHVCLGRVYIFTLHNCPQPASSLGQIMQNIGLFNVESVEVEGESATTVKPDFFKGLSNLSSVVLRANGTTHLPQEVFLETPLLRLIELDFHNIVLPKNIFTSTPHLKILTLTSKNLMILEANVFNSFNHLDTLFLNGNTPNISRAAMSGVQSLGTLEITSNNMTEIPHDLFTDLINLWQITFLKNSFLSLPENVFKNNLQLRSFTLQDNKRAIQTLPPTLLANFTYLSYVSIINCGISTLPEDLLWDSKSIRNISLAKNALTTLPERLFKDCNQLKDLDLSLNSITHLPDRLFYNARNLVVLLLNDNLLTVITR